MRAKVTIRTFSLTPEENFNMAALVDAHDDDSAKPPERDRDVRKSWQLLVWRSTGEGKKVGMAEGPRIAPKRTKVAGWLRPGRGTADFS